MKHFLLFLSLITLQAFSQITYKLELIAEGNFGTPNGDVFVRNTTVSPATNSSGMYQTANSSSGFDVLQDYKIAGDKAIFIEKPAGNGRIVIADHDSFNEIHTFQISNAPQTIGVVSDSKAYVSYGNPADMVLVDLVANTLTSVTDPGNAISSYSSHMVYARGYMFAQIGNNIVKIDTATNTVTGTISPSIGSISGLVADELEEKLWVTGGGTLKSIDLLNGDLVSSAITLGPSSTKHVRYYDEKIYFWSGSDLFIYDIASPSLPLTSIYTSTLPGSSWSFGYGRSFDIDETTGDFVIASANTFTAPGYFEVVNGTDFTVIESTSMPGCAIPNNCVLTTYHTTGTPPVPSVTPLPTINAECSVTLTAPTATGTNGQVIATTTDPTTYNAQGTFTVTWTYTDAGGTSTQQQTIIVDDTIDPVVSIQTDTVQCDETISTPEANDNCAGSIQGTTNDPTSYNAPGTYNITWTFDDNNGNVLTETQSIVVECDASGIEEETMTVSIYPNPASDVLFIESENQPEAIRIVDLNGRILYNGMPSEASTQINVSNWKNGMYFLHQGSIKKRFIIKH